MIKDEWLRVDSLRSHASLRPLIRYKENEIDMPSDAEAEAMIEVILPDGAKRQLVSGSTGTALATDISKSLAKKAIAIKQNGKLVDLALELTDGAAVEVITIDSPEALELLRHDCAHVLAEAVQELFPGTQVTIGPAIENGFYYDFAREQPFTPDDLEIIQKRMKEIIDRNEPFIREEWDRQEAIKFLRVRVKLIRQN